VVNLRMPLRSPVLAGGANWPLTYKSTLRLNFFNQQSNYLSLRVIIHGADSLCAVNP
jgi:hypothetical protein